MKRLRENNNNSEKPIVKKEESLSLPQEFRGQIKLKLWLIKNYEHKVDAITSLESILFSASKETFGRGPLLPNILGKRIKEVWNEEVKVVKRGPTNKQKRHYLNLRRKDEKSSNSVNVLDQPPLPKNWTSISESKNKTIFFNPKPIFLNNQRAITEVTHTVKEHHGGEPEHKFTIRANGVELDLQSDLDLVGGLEGMNLPQKVGTIIDFVDKSSLCEGYKLPVGEQIITCSPHSSYSVRDLSGPTSTEETRAFSRYCLIFSNSDKRCVSCKN